MALGSFPICLYREAMHLQRFTPTRFVVGVATRTYKRDDHYPICTKLHYGCLLALCGPTMYAATLCGVFRLARVWCAVAVELYMRQVCMHIRIHCIDYIPILCHHGTRVCPHTVHALCCIYPDPLQVTVIS